MRGESASDDPEHSRIRPLSSAERLAFDHVNPATRDRARIALIPCLPGTFAAITLGRFVLLARPQPGDGTSTLLAHELVHVEQWARQGRVRFSAGYVTNFIKEFRQRRRWMDSYRALVAEVEARERTRRWWSDHNDSASD